jgi:hypothetical protein
VILKLARGADGIFTGGGHGVHYVWVTDGGLISSHVERRSGGNEERVKKRKGHKTLGDSTE